MKNLRDILTQHQLNHSLEFDCINYLNMTIQEFLSKVIMINHTSEASAKSGELRKAYPEYPKFDLRALVIVTLYCSVFVVAAVGNVSAFINLFRSRRRKSRMSLLMIHLTIADLIVTFIMLPFEIAWRITVAWLGGNALCKMMLFLRAFGLYLSSNVLICISVDRYLAIMYPLMVSSKRSRGKWMLCTAWMAAICYSFPQLLVFHVDQHPHFSNFTQCVSFGYFASERSEIAYNVLCLTMMYFLPLLVIIFSYASILCKMWRKSQRSARAASSDFVNNMRTRSTSDSEYRSSNTKVTWNINEVTPSQNRARINKRPEHVVLRRSDMKCIERARIRTLKMTIFIVIAFVICWTPYAIMALWYMVDKTSAQTVPTWLQDALFMMAASNSCMNPLVYGRFAIRSAVVARGARGGRSKRCGRWSWFTSFCGIFHSKFALKCNCAKHQHHNASPAADLEG